MNRTIAPYILNSLEGLTFRNQTHTAIGPLNHQVVRFYMENARKLVNLSLSEIIDVEKVFDKIRIVGHLRTIHLNNVSDAIVESIYQLKNTLLKLFFYNCKNLTNEGLKVFFKIIFLYLIKM